MFRLRTGSCNDRSGFSSPSLSLSPLAWLLESAQSPGLDTRLKAELLLQLQLLLLLLPQLLHVRSIALWPNSSGTAIMGIVIFIP